MPEIKVEYKKQKANRREFGLINFPTLFAFFSYVMIYYSNGIEIKLEIFFLKSFNI